MLWESALTNAISAGFWTAYSQKLVVCSCETHVLHHRAKLPGPAVFAC